MIWSGLNCLKAGHRCGLLLTRQWVLADSLIVIYYDVSSIVVCSVSLSEYSWDVCLLLSPAYDKAAVEAGRQQKERINFGSQPERMMVSSHGGVNGLSDAVWWRKWITDDDDAWFIYSHCNDTCVRFSYYYCCYWIYKIFPKVRRGAG
jgi:hypothetical protein